MIGATKTIAIRDKKRDDVVDDGNDQTPTPRGRCFGWLLRNDGAENVLPHAQRPAMRASPPQT